VTAGL